MSGADCSTSMCVKLCGADATGETLMASSFVGGGCELLPWSRSCLQRSAVRSD